MGAGDRIDDWAFALRVDRTVRGAPRVLDIESGEERPGFRRPASGGVVAFSPDGATLATGAGGARDGAVALWKARTVRSTTRRSGPQVFA